MTQPLNSAHISVHSRVMEISLVLTTLRNPPADLPHTQPFYPSLPFQVHLGFIVVG